MTVAEGARLGPYEILSPLGAGGMGEVYRARDPRLGREVAVKVLPEAVATDPDRLRRFEHEARAVAALNHPNILTVHDVGNHEGSPYVVTELLEGETLRDVLTRRAPTPRQVLSWGLQAAQGLAAAHQKGIVHRDVKPENLFLTTDGRLKILDFGLAKLVALGGTDTKVATASGPSQAGVIVGTIAYMSPEQVGAEPLDHRSDLFSLGIVLYELLSGEHPFRRPTVAATLSAILHEEPPDLSVRQAGVSPAMDRMVRRCLEKRREERYQSAHDLGLALEAVLEGGSTAAALRQVEERSPYPGLSAFTEDDAARFFGREEEVAALWKSLRERTLLAVIGPSGAGKSSFVRAGVVAGRPEGWAAIVATPGAAPLKGLGQALAPHLANDPEALRKLLSFDDPETAFALLSRWRRGHDEALVVVDQFEELFTQNSAEVQGRFASLLGRLAGEGDVHVLLSMRDDFLMGCHRHEALSPVFRELTPLGPMTREGLRRALVEPAARRGYRFEDERLVEEMIDTVEGARSALPLLAFAVSRLWEKRRPGGKLLTREAYVEIGGVAGALARHAEETMERIGAAHEGTVRDLFRNLVTAQGTRAALEREELVSALPDRSAAEAVLTTLIDARLLTSWETEETGGQPARHRVEIVHESLLAAWPRLVRWQTQDADGAQLRDQLRQAAHLWEERGKAEDLLWTGSTYLDYRVWRARYPGKLSSLEEDFSSSMAARAERSKRRRRAVVGSVLASLLVVACVLAVLWSQADRQRSLAEAASRRAQASKLLALAQLEFETDPASALAYAAKSLELDDTQATRFFALRIVQQGPIANELLDAGLECFSPNGEWLAMPKGEKIRLFNQDGREPVVLSPGALAPRTYRSIAFGPASDVLALGFREELRLLSVPDGREIRRVRYGEGVDFWCPHCGIAFRRDGDRRTYYRRPWDGGDQQLLGTLELPEMTPRAHTRDLASMAWASGRKIYVKSPTRWESPPRLLGEDPAEVVWVALSESGPQLAALDSSGEIRIWDTSPTSGRSPRVLEAPGRRGATRLDSVHFSPSGRWLLIEAGGEGHPLLSLWDLEAPPGAAPHLVRSRTGIFSWVHWDPLDRGWTGFDGESERLRFWPLSRSRPRVFDWQGGGIGAVAFTADGATLVARTTFGDLRVWPLSAEAPAPFRTLPKTGLFRGRLYSSGFLSASPTRREIVVGSAGGRVQVIPVDGGDPRELEGIPREAAAVAVAFSPDGGKVSAAPSQGLAGGSRIHVWDLATGAVQRLEPIPSAPDGTGGGVFRMSFLDRDRIVAVVSGIGLMLFDLRDGKGKVLSSAINLELAVARTAGTVFGLDEGDESRSQILRVGLAGGVAVPLPYGEERTATGALALDPTGTLLASTGPGNSVQVGPVSGGVPHLLFGHTAGILALAFSPDGKWLASAGGDQTVRLWPVPDVTQVPPHRRSREEFLATLRTFTNVRAIPDPKLPNGWKLEPGPFPGWQTPPHW